MIKTKKGRLFEKAVTDHTLNSLKTLEKFKKAFEKQTKGIKVTVIIYTHRDKFFTKKGTINKRSGDVDNQLKCLLDNIFKVLGIDDSQIVEISAIKKPWAETKTVVYLELVEI